jgi:hypothetical protein
VPVLRSATIPRARSHAAGARTHWLAPTIPVYSLAGPRPWLTMNSRSRARRKSAGLTGWPFEYLIPGLSWKVKIKKLTRGDKRMRTQTHPSLPVLATSSTSHAGWFLTAPSAAY